MSSLLHPVGPQAPGVYWLRRGLVVVVIAALAVLTVLFIKLNRGSEQLMAAAPPATSPTPQTTPDTASPTTSPTPSSTPSSSGSTGSTTAGSSTGVTSTAVTSTPPATPAPVLACSPVDLRPTLTGSDHVHAKKNSTFNLSLINGSAVPCIVRVAPDNFELKIYSGSDRIWSTKDCAKSIKPISKKIGPEQAVEWKLTWNGRRSAKECKNRPEIPRAGTYIATSQLDGTTAVQWRMQLS